MKHSHSNNHSIISFSRRFLLSERGVLGALLCLLAFCGAADWLAVRALGQTAPVPAVAPTIRVTAGGGGITVTLDAFNTNSYVTVFTIINGRPVLGQASADRIDITVDGSPDPDVKVDAANGVSPTPGTTLFVGYYGIKFAEVDAGKTHVYNVTATNPSAVATNSFFVKVVWFGPTKIAPPPGAVLPPPSQPATTGKVAGAFKRWGLNLREGSVRPSVSTGGIFDYGVNLHAGGDRGQAGANAGRGIISGNGSLKRIGLRAGQPLAGATANASASDPNANPAALPPAN